MSKIFNFYAFLFNKRFRYICIILFFRRLLKASRQPCIPNNQKVEKKTGNYLLFTYY
jgi:hypothetical protein